MARKIMGAVVVIALIVGYRAYNFNKAKAEIRGTLEGLCAEDSRCKEAVATHFEECWKENASAGNRRRGMSVDGSGVVQCINGASGVDYFSYSDEDEE
jgi:hypothetical protein